MRILAISLVFALLWPLAVPAPAIAMSTAQEIAQGEHLNKEIDRQSNLVTDPFLVAWVNQVGNRLAQHRARADINYKFEILNSSEINSFALPGGFIHVDAGALNFVSSDDELAAILAHEIGHVERRHVVTLAQKANILSILIGVLSIFSPIVYALGGLGGELAIGKFSRQDELQADQYGLQLMSRAGYDPQSTVDVMAHLAALSKGPEESRYDKAFADHPPPKDRVAHLMGYAELDRPSVDQLTQRALHDEEEGRYSYAQALLAQVLKRQPNSALAREHSAVVKVAVSGSEGDHAGRALQDTAAMSAGDTGSRPSVALQVAMASNVVNSDLAAIKDQAKSGRQEIEAFYNQVRTLASGVPNLPDPKKQGNNLSVAENGLDQLARDLTSVVDLSSDAFGSALGMLEDNRAVLREMSGPLRNQQPTPRTQALLRHYPFLAAELTESSDKIVRAVARSRAALAMGSDAVHLLTDFIAALGRVDASKGDIDAKEMPALKSALEAAVKAWDDAAAMAADASDYLYAGQTKTLSSHITLLDLPSSSQRYAAFARALAFRFPGVSVPDYAATERSGETAGQIACFAWLSYETKEPVPSLIRSAQPGSGSCPDLALSRHLSAESVEIAEGLIYEDYIDKPQSP